MRVKFQQVIRSVDVMVHVLAWTYELNLITLLITPSWMMELLNFLNRSYNASISERLTGRIRNWLKTEEKCWTRIQTPGLRKVERKLTIGLGSKNCWIFLIDSLFGATTPHQFYFFVFLDSLGGEDLIHT